MKRKTRHKTRPIEAGASMVHGTKRPTERSIRSVDHKTERRFIGRSIGDRKPETGNRKPSPLEESISKQGFSTRQIEMIIRRRKELIAECLTDWAIAEKLACEFGKKAVCVHQKMLWLVKKGKIGENPNKHSRNVFTKKEIGFLIGRRDELIRQGLKDETIAHEMTQELRREFNSVISKIRQLKRSGEIQENPNKDQRWNPEKSSAKPFTGEETETIIRRRGELVSEGLTENEIAGQISQEIQRSPVGIYRKLARLVNDGKLQKNPNKYSKFTPNEIEYIRQRRNELISEGLVDTGVAKRLSTEMKKDFNSIFPKIRRLVKAELFQENLNVETPNVKRGDSAEEVAKFPENPNVNREYGEGEIAKMECMRNELIRKGLTDNEIAREIAKELEARSANSIVQKIWALVKKNVFEKNPNKPRGYTHQEEEILVRKRKELISNGFHDEKIIVSIAEELERTVNSVRGRIQLLLKQGRIEENPNKIMNFTEDEIHTIEKTREKLIPGGINDTEIARRIADQLGRTADSISAKIRQLVKKGRLPPNPSKQGGNLTGAEVLLALSQAADAMERFGEKR